MIPWEESTVLWGLNRNSEGNQVDFIWGIATPVIEELKRKKSRSGYYLRRKQDLWNAWDKLSEKNKKKIISVIIYLESGEVKTIRNNITEYEIKVEDIEYVIEQYDLWKEKKNKLSNINIKVENYNVIENKINIEVG